jgi:hypothetical protein
MPQVQATAAVNPAVAGQQIFQGAMNGSIASVPVGSQMMQLTAVVPAGKMPGQTFPIRIADGRQMMLTVPPGMKSGMKFSFMVPPMQPGQAPMQQMPMQQMPMQQMPAQPMMQPMQRPVQPAPVANTSSSTSSGLMTAAAVGAAGLVGMTMIGAAVNNRPDYVVQHGSHYGRPYGRPGWQRRRNRRRWRQNQRPGVIGSMMNATPGGRILNAIF